MIIRRLAIMAIGKGGSDYGQSKGGKIFKKTSGEKIW